MTIPRIHAASTLTHLFQPSASEYLYTVFTVESKTFSWRNGRNSGTSWNKSWSLMITPHISEEINWNFLLCIHLMQYVQLLSRASPCSTHTKASLQQVLYLAVPISETSALLNVANLGQRGENREENNPTFLLVLKFTLLFNTGWQAPASPPEILN